MIDILARTRRTEEKPERKESRKPDPIAAARNTRLNAAIARLLTKKGTRIAKRGRPRNIYFNEGKFPASLNRCICCVPFYTFIRPRFIAWRRMSRHLLLNALLHEIPRQIYVWYLPVQKRLRNFTFTLMHFN